LRTLSHNHTVQTDFGKMYFLVDYTPDGRICGGMIAHRRLNEDQAVTKLIEQLSDAFDAALKDIQASTHNREGE
jgi:hypothetical protein